MKFFVLPLFSVLINHSYCNVLWDTAVKTFFNKEEMLKLNLSRMCSWQVEILFDHEEIAYRMLDASAKIPYSGMLDSGRVELGNFDECVSIDHTFNDNRILGKYCYAGLILPDSSIPPNVNSFYKLATCTPDACSADDLVTIADYFIPDFPPLFIDEFCTTKETGKDISLGTMFSTSIFTILIFLMLAGTLYDIYCQKTGEKSHPLLLAFSVVTNTKNILKVASKPSKETIKIFSGFRIISVVWIIAGHGAQAFTTMVMPAMNWDYAYSLAYKRHTSYLFAAYFTVTTFFFMSGFLLGYLYLKRKILPWKEQLKSVPLLYLHRYIRLTAPVLLLYIFVLNIFKHLGSGPLWQSGCKSEIDNCKKYWWSYFLYIQNYVNWDELCMTPLWYISADMQMFVIAVLVLIPITVILKSHGFKLAILILGALNVLFVILNIGIKLIFPKTTNNPFDTHGRLSDYFIGLMMGIFMRFTKDDQFLGGVKPKFVSRVNFITWIIVLSGMFSVVLFSEDSEMWFNHTNKTLYTAFSRVIWALGLCWILYACYHGYGGIINWILCRPIFEVGAKLTYSIYLLHYLVLGHYSLSNRMKFYVDEYVEFYLFCGYFIESLCWSFLWTLAIESPITIIEKYFLSKVHQEESTINNNKKVSEVAV